MPSLLDRPEIRPASRPALAPSRPLEAALLEKIEELSFLRELAEGLSRASDYPRACRALTELVWTQLGARRVSYLALDVTRGLLHPEATWPAAIPDLAESELRIDEAPFAPALGAGGPAFFVGSGAPPWRTARRAALDLPLPEGTDILITAPLTARDSPLGLVVVETRYSPLTLPEHLRLLAVAETTAALALDKARDPGRAEFLAVLRHDLNNPLHTALGYLDLLLDEIEARALTEMRGAAEGAQGALRAVADLVATALELTTINRGVEALERRPVELADLAVGVAESLRPAAAERHQQLLLECRPVRLVADPRQLRRVLANLLGNAIKYSLDGATIELRCGPGTDGPDGARLTAGAWLEVEDDGRGLPAEARAHLFEKYARFHTETGIPGTGLGLYSSRAIVAAHGGTIEALARRDGCRGTLFRIRLPG